MLKEVFSFQIIKPDYIFSFSILSDKVLKVKEVVSGKKQETKKNVSLFELESFFSKLEKLGFYSWPPNMDCCACDDSSWVVMADYDGKKNRSFGVSGFEPDTWPDLLKLVEGCAGQKI